MAKQPAVFTKANLRTNFTKAVKGKVNKARGGRTGRKGGASSRKGGGGGRGLSWADIPD